MSQLTITGASTVWTMNVLAFSSPIYGQINTVQTKGLAVHFPIKMAQPVLQLDVIFRNQVDFQNFQAFVRNHQQQLSTNSTALVTLNWPARSMINYTGFIPSFKAGGMKANYAPRARFVVNLVNSFITARTDYASVAANWRSIYGGFGVSGGVLAPPTAAQQQENIVNQGQSLITGQFVNPTGNPNGVTSGVLPETAFGGTNPGIVTGTGV